MSQLSSLHTMLEDIEIEEAVGLGPHYAGEGGYSWDGVDIPEGELIPRDLLRRSILEAEWDEKKHPRNKGRFAKKGEEEKGGEKKQPQGKKKKGPAKKEPPKKEEPKKEEPKAAEPKKEKGYYTIGDRYKRYIAPGGVVLNRHPDVPFVSKKTMNATDMQLKKEARLKRQRDELDKKIASLRSSSKEKQKRDEIKELFARTGGEPKDAEIDQANDELDKILGERGEHRRIIRTKTKTGKDLYYEYRNGQPVRISPDEAQGYFKGGKAEALNVDAEDPHAPRDAIIGMNRAGRDFNYRLERQKGMKKDNAQATSKILGAIDLVVSGVFRKLGWAGSNVPWSTLAYSIGTNIKHPDRIARVASELVLDNADTILKHAENTNDSFRAERERERLAKKEAGKEGESREERLSRLIKNLHRYNEDRSRRMNDLLHEAVEDFEFAEDSRVMQLAGLVTLMEEEQPEGDSGILPETMNAIAEQVAKHNNSPWYGLLLISAYDMTEDIEASIIIADKLFEKHKKQLSEEIADDEEGLGDWIERSFPNLVSQKNVKGMVFLDPHTRKPLEPLHPAEKARMEQNFKEKYRQEIMRAKGIHEDAPPEGNQSQDPMKVRKEVDLIDLPEEVQGTNCGNCMYVDEDKDYCNNPNVKLPVTTRMCCALWDRKDVIRPWARTPEVKEEVVEVKESVDPIETCRSLVENLLGESVAPVVVPAVVPPPVVVTAAPAAPLLNEARLKEMLNTDTQLVELRKSLAELTAKIMAPQPPQEIKVVIPPMPAPVINMPPMPAPVINMPAPPPAPVQKPMVEVQRVKRDKDGNVESIIVGQVPADQAESL